VNRVPPLPTRYHPHNDGLFFSTPYLFIRVASAIFFFTNFLVHGCHLRHYFLGFRPAFFLIVSLFSPVLSRFARRYAPSLFFLLFFVSLVLRESLSSSLLPRTHPVDCCVNCYFLLNFPHKVFRVRCPVLLIGFQALGFLFSTTFSPYPPLPLLSFKVCDRPFRFCQGFDNRIKNRPRS